MTDLGSARPSDLRRRSWLGRGDGLTPFGDDVLCGWLAVHRAAGVPTDAVDVEVRCRPRPDHDCCRRPCSTAPCTARCIPEFAAYVAALGSSTATGATSARTALTKVGHTSGRGLLAGARLALDRLGHEGVAAA